MTTQNEKQLKDNIQKNLIFYRKKMKRTQKDLAVALGVSAAAISSWECGNNSPDIDTLFAICKELQVGLYDMCGVFEETKQMPEEETRLLNTYRSLNQKGREKLLERAEELRDLGYEAKGDAAKMA